jgi:hypothetical protein
MEKLDCMVVSVVQTIVPSDPDPGSIGVFDGQLSFATAPAVTFPLPWTLKIRKRGAGSVTVKPFPVVAFTCSAVVTFSMLIVFPFL